MLRIYDKLLFMNSCHSIRICSASFGSRKNSEDTQVAKYQEEKRPIGLSLLHQRRDRRDGRRNESRKSAVKSFKDDEESHFHKKKFQTYDDHDDEDIGYDDDEQDFDAQIMRANRTYDEFVQEEEARKKKVLYKIIERKYFRPPPEPCLLTWAAKEQLRYLHETDEATWTPEKLAESFPISVSGVKKLLKNKFSMATGVQVEKHDKAVYNRWKQLRSGEGPILVAINPKFLLGNFDIEHAQSNKSLPLPSSEWQAEHLPKPIDRISRSNEPVGEFENIITEYHALCQKKDGNDGQLSQSTDATNQTDITLLEPIDNVPKRMARKQVTFSEFKENMQRHLLAKSIDDPEPYQKFKAWFRDNDVTEISSSSSRFEMEPPKDKMTDYFEGNIQKFKDAPSVDIKWDVHRDVKNPDGKEGYMYDSNKGYQRPYGRYEETDQIEIPADMWRKGAVYRCGNCYYDDNGQLMYRVPFSQGK